MHSAVHSLAICFESDEIGETFYSVNRDEGGSKSGRFGKSAVFVVNGAFVVTNNRLFRESCNKEIWRSIGISLTAERFLIDWNRVKFKQSPC